MWTNAPYHASDLIEEIAARSVAGWPTVVWGPTAEELVRDGLGSWWWHLHTGAGPVLGTSCEPPTGNFTDTEAMAFLVGILDASSSSANAKSEHLEPALTSTLTEQQLQVGRKWWSGLLSQAANRRRERSAWVE